MEKLNLLRHCGIAFVLFLMSQVAVAQEGYKGIIPMVSSCHDVKNILGRGKCGEVDDLIKLPKETLWVYYTTKECEEFYGKKWNVPIGTVVSVTRFFRKPPTLDDLGITIIESEYNKSYTDAVGQIIYEKKDGGLNLIVENKRVSNIEYTPTFEDNSKFCKCAKCL